MTSEKIRLGTSKIEDLIKEAVEIYNRYRGVESKAQILDVDNDRVVIKFEGHFCFTCGVNDWVEDLKYVMEDVGLDANLEQILEPEDPAEPTRIGVFRIRGVKSNERA
jgi:hypothetical protein